VLSPIDRRRSGSIRGSTSHVRFGARAAGR
jgi:hypothetical protein